MEIEIYTKKDDGKIKSVRELKGDIDPIKLKEMVAKYNANETYLDTVEVREATPAEKHLLEALEDKRYIDKYLLEGLEADVGKSLDAIREIQYLLEN